MLRADSLPLRIETGRHSHPPTPLYDRKCDLCQLNILEDSPHFLIECPFYVKLRSKLINEIRNEQIAFSIENFNVIMRNPQPKIQRLLAKTIFKMMKHRKNSTL